MSVVVVFVNNKDKSIEVLGKALMNLLDRKYYVFTRMPSEYPFCAVENTMSKIQEIARYQPEESRLIVSFGCRVLPNNIREIEKLVEKTTGNVVFLKRLRGSKTWRETDAGLTFDNERIADCGIFVITCKDILKAQGSNFNTFIRQLLREKSLSAAYVDFWVFANSDK